MSRTWWIALFWGSACLLLGQTPSAGKDDSKPGAGINQQAMPIYLPVTSFWRLTMAGPPPPSGNAELDLAYRKYRAGDFLTARSHLYRARQSMGSSAPPALRLRALSLACLLDMGPIPDQFLILKTSFGDGAGEDSGGSLLSERWNGQEKAAVDASLAPWIGLFSGYQQYHRGHVREALAEWQELYKDEKADSDIRGLAGLGMLELGGEALLDAKRTATPPQITLSQIVQVAIGVKLVFDNELSVGQCILLEAQANYIAGNRDAAFESLGAANKYFRNYRPGWVESNLVGVIGESRSGNTEAAGGALLNVVEALGDRRVPPEQVQALSNFAARIPSLTGDGDTRPIDLQLADAREFYRWASATRDPMLELISLRVLSRLLLQASYWTDAGFYNALAADLQDRYRSAVPFEVRVRRAALLDYDFLRQSHYLDTHDPFPTGLTAMVDAYIAGERGSIPAKLKYLPGMTQAEAEAVLEKNLAPLRKIAKDGDDAARSFHDRMKSGDVNQPLNGIIDGVMGVVRFLNRFETTHATTETLTENERDLLGKLEVHAELTAEYWVPERKSSALEIDQDRQHMLLAAYEIGAMVAANERVVLSGVNKTISFYDQHRDELTPPELLDTPFFVSGRTESRLPDASAKRRELAERAVKYLDRQHLKRLVESAKSGDHPAGGASQSDQPSAEDREALAFFERNFELDESKSHADTPQVTRSQHDGATAINVVQAYKETYRFRKGSEYVDVFEGKPDMDFEGRAAAAARAWLDPEMTAGEPRMDRILDALYKERVGEALMGQYLGTNPEQLSTQNSPFSTLLATVQTALSAVPRNDFQPLPGKHDFAALRDLLHKDEAGRTFVSTMAHLDPEAADASANIAAASAKLQDIVDQYEQQNKGDAKGGPLHDILNLVPVGTAAAHRPLLLLLLGDEAAARQTAAELAAKSKDPARPQSKRSADAISVAVYDVATGQFAAAVQQLAPVAAAIRTQDRLQAHQLDYLLGMCYRRIGQRALEIQSLQSSAAGIDRVRLTLPTRNEQVNLQPVRQMIYEELLTALMAEKRYSDMAEVLVAYKKSSKLPAAVLAASKTKVPRLSALLEDATGTYDTLSRADVWTPQDLSMLTLSRELTGASEDKGSGVDRREAILSALNHITEIVIDQLQTADSAPVQNARTAPRRADGLTVSYFVGASGLFRVSTAGAGASLAQRLSIAPAELAESCARFRSAIEERKDPTEAGVRLYQVLLGDLAELRPGTRLQISPDGPLNFVPFQALKRSADAPYLIVEHPVSYLSGTTAAPASAGLGRRVLLVGNPDGSLSAADEEVNGIAAVKAFDPGKPLHQSDATLENVRNQLGAASLVHLATHARANASQPNFAYLQLANWDRIYSYSLGGLDFSGKRVFLSACETRLGAVQPGDDIYGLADAILSSGAASVISTLWRIESSSSALFAQHFYAKLAETQDATEALARTAREFIEGKIYQERGGATVTLDAPLFWAAFNRLAPEQ